MSSEARLQQLDVDRRSLTLPFSVQEIWVVGLSGALLGAAWALLAGQDLGWDLRNYYYYSAYAWLHGRAAYDIAPGQFQNWLNPLVYVPQYLLVNHLPPLAAGALLGAAAGINFALIYLLARTVIITTGSSLGVVLAVFSAIGGASTPQFLDALGRFSGDWVVSALVLTSLLALLLSHSATAESRDISKGLLFSGLLMGAACGLKLTVLPFAAGLTVAVLALWRLLGMSWLRFSQYAASGVTGFLITGGYWTFRLLMDYHNPVFPFGNGVFRSPWAAPASLWDERFMPRTLQDALSYPFRWFAGGYSTSEGPFRDARFAVLAILLLATLLYWLLLRFTVPPPERGASRAHCLASQKHFWVVTLFSLVSYIVWMAEFSIQRYLMPVGLVAALLLFLLLDRLVAAHTVKTALFIGLTLVTSAATNFTAANRVSYAKDWFGVQLAPAVSQPNTLFLLLGDEPGSYVVPFLPVSDRVIRLAGNFVVPAAPGSRAWSGDFLLSDGSPLGRAAREAVRNHHGPMRTLSLAALTPGDGLQLARFGLEINESGCEKFQTRADQFTSCPVQTRADKPFLAADPQTHCIAWKASPSPGARLYTQENGSEWREHAEGPEGYEYLGWLQPGRQLAFKMIAWDGNSEGKVLAVATVDEKGKVSIEY